MKTAATYLEPFEEGGIHKLNSSALLNPKNIKLNKYGNLPRNKLSSLKNKDNVFVGELSTRYGKGVNGVWQRKKAKKVKKNRKRLSRSPNGTRRERVPSRPLSYLFDSVMLCLSSLYLDIRIGHNDGTGFITTGNKPGT